MKHSITIEWTVDDEDFGDIELTANTDYATDELMSGFLRFIAEQIEAGAQSFERGMPSVERH